MRCWKLELVIFVLVSYAFMVVSKCVHVKMEVYIDECMARHELEMSGI